MSFWNYIGEFFLFRWLCGKIMKSTKEHDAHTGDFGNNRSSLHHEDYGSDYHDSGRHSFQNDWNSGSSYQSYDDFLDEQDDYDMMGDDF